MIDFAVVIVIRFLYHEDIETHPEQSCKAQVLDDKTIHLLIYLFGIVKMQNAWLQLPPLMLPIPTSRLRHPVALKSQQEVLLQPRRTQ